MTAAPHRGKLASQPLPASLDYAELHVHSTAKLFGADMDDPGLTRMTGTVSILDIRDDDDDEEPVAGIEGIGLSLSRQPDGTTEITILQAQAIVLNLSQVANPYESLDADSQELEAYGCLFDLDGGGLHPDLETMLEAPFGDQVVIGERVRIAPAWRGRGGAGRYLAGRLFRQMCTDPVVVATQPFPLDITPDDDGNADQATLQPALRQIERTWKSIGFQPYKNDIWILDPSASEHQHSMAALEQQLGLTSSPR